MRILHTSDWHVGKKIGRYDRIDEYETVLAEIVEIADREGAELVVHSGDLFDRPIPPLDSLQLALSGLVRLADGGRRPVVVVAGNHDSPELFETLGPFLSPFGVHLVGRIKRPEEGGVLSIAVGGATAHIACFPFLRAAQVVDFMASTDEWYGTYADKVRRLTERYAAAVAERAGTNGIGLLVAHFMVTGARIRTADPRGERELHIGEAYSATESAIPTRLHYVAMGHIHAPQPVPGANVPAAYAGSLLQLDFGEAGEAKRVVLVDAEPGRPATVGDIPVTGGRELVKVSGRWEKLAARDDLDEAYLHLVVETDGPDPALMDRVRERFERVVHVTPAYERQAVEAVSVTNRPLSEVYAEYHLAQHHAEATEALLSAFGSLQEEVAGAAS